MKSRNPVDLLVVGNILFKFDGESSHSSFHEK